MIDVGVQKNGQSPQHTKLMALNALNRVCYGRHVGAVGDIGGGRGELSQELADCADEVWLVDYSPALPCTLPRNVKSIRADLNVQWPLKDELFDFVFSLECIEHVENPRHFVRELRRITRKSGYMFLTTPNQHSLTSKAIFLLRGQHRFFQEFSYPAHITAVLRSDFERMAFETGMKIVAWSYANTDTIPLIHLRFYLPTALFSETLGVLFQRID
jgi:2-polyprenyl-3-methyl-5-hydroxy-6-metoxy-1,4-benzoquinol methylase